jgi:hypothetical protein
MANRKFCSFDAQGFDWIYEAGAPRGQKAGDKRD